MPIPWAGVGAMLTGVSNLFGRDRGVSANRALRYQSRWREEDRHDRLHAVSNLVKDAKRAGIHPLTALGVSGYTPSPMPTIPVRGGRRKRS